MGYILLAAVIAVISIILIIFIKDDDNIAISISSIVFCVDLCLSIVLSINATMSKEELDQIVKTYNNLKAQTEIVSSSDDKTLRNAIIPDLQKKVEEMNKIISTNNNRKNNWWNSVFYYEEIGELKPLKIEY